MEDRYYFAYGSQHESGADEVQVSGCGSCGKTSGLKIIGWHFGEGLRGKWSSNGSAGKKELDRMVEILCRRQKNNPALWANRAWARPRWPKGLPSASPTSRYPGCSRGGVCWRWTWPASWLVRSTAATSKSGSRICWKNSSGTAAPSSSWMSSTPSSAPVRQRGPSTRPAS